MVNHSSLGPFSSRTGMMLPCALFHTCLLSPIEMHACYSLFLWPQAGFQGSKLTAKRHHHDQGYDQPVYFAGLILVVCLLGDNTQQITVCYTAETTHFDPSNRECGFSGDPSSIIVWFCWFTLPIVSRYLARNLSRTPPTQSARMKTEVWFYWPSLRTELPYVKHCQRWQHWQRHGM